MAAAVGVVGVDDDGGVGAGEGVEGRGGRDLPAGEAEGGGVLVVGGAEDGGAAGGPSLGRSWIAAWAPASGRQAAVVA